MKKYILIILICIYAQQISSQHKLSEKFNLMPWPKEISENNQKLIISQNFTIGVPDVKNQRIFKATTNFLRRLSGRTGIFIDNGFAVNNSEKAQHSLVLKYEKIGKLALHEDESYQLTINNSQITINAATDIGAIRGLETVLQLTNNTKENYYFEGVNIKDSPRFPWRGLMIDVARHFQPVDVIKRNLDAMASVKMNVFHWHLTDDQGFRVQINSRPKLHELASDGDYYTQNQIKEVVAYAADLGIRVVPEFDVPGHASSWLTAYPEVGSKDTIYSVERFAGIFDPTLDPTNDKTYELLDAVFSEVAPLFPDQYFHIGGDENEGKHWDENKGIQAFKKKHKLETNHDLQNYFNLKVQKILTKNGKIMMGWDEILQPTLPKDVVIHSWRGKEAMVEAAKQGYKTVLSKGFYIDLLESVVGHYNNDPIDNATNLSKEELKNILGGEATMWSELVTPLTIDSRIWPRTAAIAERLWSESSVNDVDNMLKRLDVLNYRLEELGITHVRNRDVILRNITNNQNIESLKLLTNLSEPLKGYTRNQGGKEYKSFSPFTLFADACVVDAVDAIRFNRAVKEYLGDSSKENKEILIGFFNRWIDNNTEFQKLKPNPKLNALYPLSEKLSELASILKNAIVTDSFELKSFNQSKKILITLQKPTVDTELAVIVAIEKLLVNFEKLYIKE